MADLNQVLKTDYSALKIDYTSKDYNTILDDLINSISGISQKWNSTDTNDPGMILVKLMAIMGDMLFYNQDMQSLEVYPNSVTQRKNAASIYKLIGYKMRWYKSSVLEANLVNTYSNSATVPRFCTFSTEDGEIVYTTFKQYELPSNTTNNGMETLVELVQGIPVTPTRSSNNPYPDAGKSWHTVYGYNYTTDDILNNRIYLRDANIDQDHIILIDDTNEEWELKDNIYLTTSVGKFFEFGIDVNDQAYLELVDYWGNYNLSKFKIFYIRSLGEEGQVYANTLKKLTGNVWSRGEDINTVYNVSSFIHFTHYDSTLGYDPETPDEARKNSVIYQNTLDTLITLADFERATLRSYGVANVRATDLTNDPGLEITRYIGDLNRDTLIDESDITILENYLADPIEYPLTAFQKKLADINQDGIIDTKDLECLKQFINPKFVHIGDINQDGIIDNEDLKLFQNYIANPDENPLSNFQLRLADMNQDGKTDETDLGILERYLNKTMSIEDIELMDEAASGSAGITELSERELLEGFVVKLYILRNEAADSIDDDTYINMIRSDLQEYKILPLSIDVDLHSIKKYYWTIKGKFYTKEPLSRDDLQTIIVSINNGLRYKYSIDKVNFNTLINYKDVIETILEIDDRILAVDLDPIVYNDLEGNEIPKEQLSGEYTEIIPRLTNENDADNLHYKFTLPKAPILPGSVMIRINQGQYVLRDNNNGSIFNIDNILAKKGKIDYVTGDVDIEFTSPVYDDLIINYTHNETNIAVYKNLSTQTFYFDSTSLEDTDIQDIV